MKTNFVHKPESNTLDFSLAPLKTHIMRFLNAGLLVRNATSLHSAGLDRDLGILAGYAARRSKGPCKQANATPLYRFFRFS